MSKAHPPELKKYMDKKVSLKLNAARTVNGIFRGYDPFMNIVIDEGVEVTKTGERHSIGILVTRGDSVILVEALDRI
ncbi:small nuclear ribonucleoprotein G-like [Watersipora subatra]|uniref:small nuclear ribonucleoprotein G-like n=1 Tax=Watersipora subatra TaxID=2589382 RepID=UPI00355B2DD0